MKPPLGPPIKVNYKALPAIPHVLWPILDLGLSYKRNVLPYKAFALADSGASSSIIRPELAEIVGFNLSQGKKIWGRSVSGAYQGIVLPESIDVDIWGHKFDFRFTAIKGLVWDVILGEDSIFEVARLDFQKYKGFFEIRFRQDIN